jgi:hypothetical protein
VKRLVSDHQQIVFAFNESKDSVDVTVSLDVPWTPQHAIAWGDDQDVPFQRNQNKITLKKTFAPEEVWVVSLESQ